VQLGKAMVFANELDIHLYLNLRQHETPGLESEIRSLTQKVSRKKQEAGPHEMEFSE
jgi:hypothetical protein